MKLNLQRKEYATPAEKKRDFWRGFWLWWGMNVVLSIATMYLLPSFGPSRDDNEVASTLRLVVVLLVVLLPYVINIGLVIYLAQTRSQMALGMLAAFGTGLAIVIILGIVLTIVCFAQLRGSNP